MMKARLLAVSVTALALSACVTAGRPFDDAPTATFVLGQTTRDQALAALGPANYEVVRADGLIILRWHYRRFGLGGLSERTVSANFRDDRLIYLHAPRKDESISPF